MKKFLPSFIFAAAITVIAWAPILWQFIQQIFKSSGGGGSN